MTSAELREVLEANRRHFFVGRSTELEEADRLFHDGNETRLLFFVAPGGYGKTTLLTEIGARMREAGRRVVHIDARLYQPNPADISRILDQKLSVSGSLSDQLLIVDTFEQLGTLETWFYRNLLPGMPSSLRFIIAGRQPPAPRWRTDPAWIGMMRVVRLADFSERETHGYLERRGVGTAAWERAWIISHGNPLLLALVADVCERLGTLALDKSAGANELHTLMLELVREGLTPAQQRALQALSIVRTLSCALLKAMLPNDNAEELFEWLSGQSFIRAAERGLFPHDLMRESLFSDSQRRDPDNLETMIRRAENFYAERLVPEAIIPLEELFSEIAYLSRHGKSPAQLIGLLEEEPLYADAPRDDEVAIAAGLIDTFQGQEQRLVFDEWNARQPHNFIAIRNADGEMKGFVQLVEFGDLEEKETKQDPVVNACRRLIDQRGLAEGHEACVARFWLDRDVHLAPSGVQIFVLTLVMARAIAHEKMGYGGVVQQDDEIARVMASAAGHEIVAGAELDLAGTPVITTLHDWRHESVAAWMIRSNRQIRGMSVAPGPIVPDQEELKRATRHALRHFTRADRLKSNPLIKRPAFRMREGGSADNVESLRVAMMHAAESLLDSPKTAGYYDVLKQTYFSPKKTQLDAAAALNMAPSTYYRRLAIAVELLTETLRRQLF